MRILYIAPHCFPVSNPEAIVNAKLAMALHDAGHDLTIITRQYKHQKYQFTKEEEQKWEVLLAKTKFVFVPTGRSLAGLMRLFLTFLKTGVFFTISHWAYDAINEAEQVLKERKFDILITRSQPSSLVGLYIKRKFNIPWISNINDPYPGFIKYPAPYGNGPNAKLNFTHTKFINDWSTLSDYFTFPSERLRNYTLLYFPELDIHKTTVIPHIASKPTEDVIVENSNTDKVSVLSIIHAGSVAAPRDPIPFLHGFKKFLSTYPDKEIRVSFLGVVPENFSDSIRELGLENKVSLLGTLPYSKSLDEISKNDFALLIEAKCEEGIFLPSKIIDYLQCDKPILALSPANGVLSDLAVDYPAIQSVENNDDFICEKLNKIYELWLNDPTAITNSIQELFDYFSAETVVDKFEEIFKKIAI